MLLNGWILDDGVLGGNREDVVQAFRIVERGTRDRGLILSTEATVNVSGDSKSRVWCPDSDVMSSNPLDIGVLPVVGDGFIHLGCPVGTEHFVALHIHQRIEKIKAILDKLQNVSDAHSEFVLLRSCFSSPKVSYLMRTTTPTLSTTTWLSSRFLTLGATSQTFRRPACRITARNCPPQAHTAPSSGGAKKKTLMSSEQMSCMKHRYKISDLPCC